MINAMSSHHGLSSMSKKLIGKWKGENGRNTYIFYGADNIITAMNEDGHCDQLNIKDELIIPTRWDVKPDLSNDGKLLNWGNGAVWTR